MKEKKCNHLWYGNSNKGSYCGNCNKYASDLFIAEGTSITIYFPDNDAAMEWKSWMCDGGGEQHAFEYDEDYWYEWDYHQGKDVYVKKTKKEKNNELKSFYSKRLVK